MSTSFLNSKLSICISVTVILVSVIVLYRNFSHAPHRAWDHPTHSSRQTAQDLRRCTQQAEKKVQQQLAETRRHWSASSDPMELQQTHMSFKKTSWIKDCMREKGYTEASEGGRPYRFRRLVRELLSSILR